MRKVIVVLMLLCLAGVANAGWVNGYTRRDGTYVNGYYRSDPDQYKSNNYGEMRKRQPSAYYPTYDKTYDKPKPVRERKYWGIR